MEWACAEKRGCMNCIEASVLQHRRAIHGGKEPSQPFSSFIRSTNLYTLPTLLWRELSRPQGRNSPKGPGQVRSKWQLVMKRSVMEKWGEGGICRRGHGIWNGGAAAGGRGKDLRTVQASWTVTWSGLADHEESCLPKISVLLRRNLAAPKPSRTCCQQVQIISFKPEWLLSALLPSWNNDLKECGFPNAQHAAASGAWEMHSFLNGVGALALLPAGTA